MTSTLEQKAIALWGAEGLAISIAKRLAAERARLIIISQYSTSSGLAQDLVQSYDGCQAIGIQGSLHSNVAAVALANEIRQIANETFSCRNIQAIIFCPSFPSHSTSSAHVLSAYAGLVALSLTNTPAGVSEIEASSHSIECAEPFLKVGCSETAQLFKLTSFPDSEQGRNIARGND